MNGGYDDIVSDHPRAALLALTGNVNALVIHFK
jgi:hypothetical protein